MSYYDLINPELELSLDRDFGGIQQLSIGFLTAVARGEVNIQALCEYELGLRGYDADGNWVGFSNSTNPLLAKYERANHSDL